MIAYNILTEYFRNPSKKLHCGNVLTCHIVLNEVMNWVDRNENSYDHVCTPQCEYYRSSTGITKARK